MTKSDLTLVETLISAYEQLIEAEDWEGLGAISVPANLRDPADHQLEELHDRAQAAFDRLVEQRSMIFGQLMDLQSRRGASRAYRGQ